MFHPEFYPTPIQVLEQMHIDCDQKIVLEPSAGKGNIVDFLTDHGATEVLTFEINKDLQEIVKTKSHLLGPDFFQCTPEQISHINMIVMNPPFSNADKHIYHAWEIAPDGCEIIALCNYETISKDYMYRRLSNLIKEHGLSENLGDCFSDSERKTGVEVGLIRLFKPIRKEGFEFEGFFMEEDEEEAQEIGIMPYNEVRALVNRYVGTMMAYDSLKEKSDLVSAMISQIGMSNIQLNVGYNDSITTKEQFSKTLQKRSWAYIFSKMNMEKYVTSGVMKDINKFVETQQKVPFTMKNIYKMFEIIVGTRETTFRRALEEAVDHFTKYTHENRYDIPGWKTNDGHMLNKKFIIDGIVKLKWSGGAVEAHYGTWRNDHLDDLTKVLCNLTGKNYNEIGSYYKFSQDNQGFETNTWYEFGFFECKFYKKGTGHFKFKNIEDWYLLNKAYGELKGFVLPETYKKSA